MMTLPSLWTQTEQSVVESAFRMAHERETTALMDEIRQRVGSLACVEDMWRLHDRLSIKRHEIDGKYDNDQAALLFVLAQLIKEGWLYRHELEGLAEDKVAKVFALVRM